MTVPPAPRAEASPFAKLALDLGPLLVFFVAFVVLGRVLADPKQAIFVATGIFMAATAAAMLASRMTSGRISPMLWFSGVMVFVLGGATLLFHDETFIKIKPTIYYAIVSAILVFGLWTGRPTLQLVLGAAYPGLTDRGWRLLTRNWAIFFACMGIANEIVWRHTTTSVWLSYKLWGVMPATVLFALANLPMLLKHGLTDATAAPDAPPVE